MATNLLRGSAALVIASTCPLAAAPARADTGTDGPCTDDRGVTVVVDFGPLGGDPLVRCVPDFGTGTGLDALRLAGVEIEGVAATGDGFVCRIDGRPAADEDLSAGLAGYRETCRQIPPTAAHWSYWYAADGGGWVESPLGVKNRQVVAGGFEGWSYTLGEDGNVPPATVPERRSGQDPVSPAPEPSSERSAAASAAGQPGGGQPGGGPPAGTVLGLGALGVVALIGAVVAVWRRLQH